MNRDEIIEREVEKAEQHYRDRRNAFAMNRFHRVIDPRGVDPETNMAHFQMDLAEIAELYGFNPETGEYGIQAGGWRAPIDTIWKLPDDIFDPSGWLNIPHDELFRREVEQRSLGAIHDPRFV